MTPARIPPNQEGVPFQSVSPVQFSQLVWGGLSGDPKTADLLCNIKTQNVRSPNLAVPWLGSPLRGLEFSESVLGASSTRGQDPPPPSLPIRKVPHFSQLSSVSSVQFSQFSWFGEASRGAPKSQICYGILKVKSLGPET